MKKHGHKIVMALAVAAFAGLLIWMGKQPMPGCYITQYADATGLQAMFYTIENDDGSLIVIDGGNVGNEDYVRSVIEKKGGHVDAWFLTHPHPDHIGVFNMLWEEMQGDIDVVYAPEIDYLTYRDRAYEWDGFDGFETFLELMSETDKVAYLHTGDELEAGGLRFEILHACGDDVYENSRDIGNDSGLMIMVTNQEESMLFCADVGINMSEIIVAEHGHELKCDYIQMSHHGNGGLSEEFYRLASPGTAFFDAPEWLMNPGEGESYTTPANRQLMESLGAEVYYYRTAPNQIRLR